jgi:hypothetical protein
MLHCGRVFSVDDKVGDYEIVARLESGGMATLFLPRRTGASGCAKRCDPELDCNPVSVECCETRGEMEPDEPR